MKLTHSKRIAGLMFGLVFAAVNHHVGALAEFSPPGITNSPSDGGGGGGGTNEPCAPTLTVNSLSANSFTFNITGGGSGIRRVWTTSDLNRPITYGWDNIGQITLNGGSQTFTDNTIGSSMYRFYKVSTTNGDCCSIAIGFIRVDVGSGTTNWPGTQALIANQLYAANTLNGLFNPMPDGNYLPAGTILMKWDGSSQFINYVWDGSSWGGNGGVSLSPGEGAFLVHPLTNDFRVSFAGLVQDGTYTMTLPGGVNNLVSSTVPKAGGLQTALGYVPTKKDIVQRWVGPPGFYTSSVYTMGGWGPSEPTIRVGEAFFIKGTNTTYNWQTTFTGCPYQQL